MIDPLTIWKAEFSKLPLDPTGLSGIVNLAKFIDARVSNKMGMSPSVAAVDAPAKAVFTWQPSVFVASLLGLTFTPLAAVGAAKMAAAWAAATQVSTFIIAPGAVISPPPPPSNGSSSVISLSIIEPPSIIKAQKALLNGLISAGLASTPLDSEIPKLFRDAFLSLTFAVTGLDTTPPPAGPLPISLVGVPAA